MRNLLNWTISILMSKVNEIIVKIERKKNWKNKIDTSTDNERRIYIMAVSRTRPANIFSYPILSYRDNPKCLCSIWFFFLKSRVFLLVDVSNSPHSLWQLVGRRRNFTSVDCTYFSSFFLSLDAIYIFFISLHFMCRYCRRYKQTENTFGQNLSNL